MTSSIVGCIYNVPQSINEEDILEVLSNQNGDKVIRLTRFNKESNVRDSLNKVEDFWLQTLENIPPRDDYTKLTDYVTETWIEEQFSQPAWNHYQTEGPRTNNHLEGWYNKLKKRVGVTHPTIYKIIEEFKKEQAVNEIKIEQYSNGGHKHKRAKKYREIDARLATLKTELTTGAKTFIEYSDAASYLLKLVQVVFSAVCLI